MFTNLIDSFINLSFIFHFLGGFLCGALGRWWNRLWLLAHTDDLFYPLFLFGVYTGVGGYFSSIPVCFCYCRRRCFCCCFVSNSLLSLPLVVLLSYIPFAAILFFFLCVSFSPIRLISRHSLKISGTNFTKQLEFLLLVRNDQKGW